MIKNIVIFLLFFIFTDVEASNFNLKKITNLNKPWGSSFINENEIIITEVSGKIIFLNLNDKTSKEIYHNLNLLEHGQGGLLDILYDKGKVWVYYSEYRGNNKTCTSIAIGNFNKNKINFKNIFQSHPPIDSGYHFGSRIVIKGNYIYASTGERGMGMIAQDATKHPGSIIRIYKNGKIPEDNPKFEGKNNCFLKFIKLE